MHFVAIDERLRALDEIRRRLKPGAPFILAHMSFPQARGERELWLARCTASEIGARLPLLGPDKEEAMLRSAGFVFRGWVIYACRGYT